MMFPKPNFKRRIPKASIRNEFKPKIRMKIMSDYDGNCAGCGCPANQIHHVMPRSRSGRGVYTNGMPVCNTCHTFIHNNNKYLSHFIKLHTKKYGEDFYKDEWDV